MTIQSKCALLLWLWVKVWSEFNYSLLTESLVAPVTVSPPRHCSQLIMQAVTIMSVKYTLIKIQNIDMIWPIFFQTKQIQTYRKHWINKGKISQFTMSTMDQKLILRTLSSSVNVSWVSLLSPWVPMVTCWDSDFKFHRFKDIRVKPPPAGLAWLVLPAHCCRRLTVNDNDTKLQTLTFQQVKERDEKL